MENWLRKRFTACATAVGISALSATAAATDTYDPLDAKAVLAKAEKSAIDKGTGVLTDMGKNLLGRALDAYVPGLSAIFGLSSGDPGSQAIIDAVVADGEQTRTLILQFWDWARAHQASTIHADYAAVEYEITSWSALPTTARLTNRTTLSTLVRDCISVMTKFQSAPHPWERLDYLHSYAVLLNLTISLSAEQSELEIVGAAWEQSGSGKTPTDWWLSLSESARATLIAQVADTKQTRVSGLLLPGLQVSFADQLRGMDQGTLPGGSYGTSDYVYARDLQFSPPKFYPDGGQPTWRYFVGRDPSGYCVHESTYCKAYLLDQGSYNASTGKYYFTVHFDGGSGPYYTDVNAAYEDHKAVLLKDMIERGYGPIRGFAENWWDVWNYGGRERLGLDDQLDAYLDEADIARDGKLGAVALLQTKNIAPEEKSHLYGFAAAQGLDSVGLISDAAFDNLDYLDARVTYLGLITATQYPWWLHRLGIRAWPRTAEELTRQYRGFPAAKLIALGASLR